MRVCFLTHYFPPEVGAPQTRIALLAATLARHGHTVTVHTGFPHYPDGGVKAPYANRPWLVERRDGVTIVRSAVYPAANRGFLTRVLDHTGLAASAMGTAWLSGPADVVIAETPPLFTAAAGVIYARAKRAALVVNVADRWPASAVELGALSGRPAIAAAEALERWVYRHAELVTTPTDGLARMLRSLPEIAGRARRLWPVIDIDRFAPSSSGSAPGDPLRVLYAGTVGMAHGLQTLVGAAAAAGPENVHVTIAGGGAEALQIAELVAARGLVNVELRGVVPAAEIPSLYAASDASAVLLRDLPIFRGALPTKMFEAMAAGRPLIVSARGESADLVREARAGVAVEPEDPGALARAFDHLRRDPELRATLGRAGRAYVEAHFGAERAAAAWSDALQDAVAERS